MDTLTLILWAFQSFFFFFCKQSHCDIITPLSPAYNLLVPCTWAGSCSSATRVIFSLWCFFPWYSFNRRSVDAVFFKLHRFELSLVFFNRSTARFTPGVEVIQALEGTPGEPNWFNLLLYFLFTRLMLRRVAVTDQSQRIFIRPHRCN